MVVAQLAEAALSWLSALEFEWLYCFFSIFFWHFSTLLTVLKKENFIIRPGVAIFTQTFIFLYTM